MKKQVCTFLIALVISSITLGQNTQINPDVIKMGWTFVSPIILKKINDPLTKEIIIKAIPKIINQDVKGASLEITDAIYRVKNVKVGNKEFLSQLEKNVNESIKSIKQNDYATAVNSLIKTVSFTERYLKSGILDKPDSKSEVSLASISNPNVITKSEINSKIHIGKNNNYLFFLPTGVLSELGKNSSSQSTDEEEFNIDQDDGKNYNLGVANLYSPDLKDVSVESFQSNNEAAAELKSVIVKTLTADLGEGQIIKSEIANYNFKALKYTYSYLDKATSISSMAYVIIAFQKSSMFFISFKTSINDFPETKKSFENFMENFYIIGVDEISNNSNESIIDNAMGNVIVSNSSEYSYDIYIDNVFKKRLSGKSKSEKIPVKEGNNRKLYAIQVTGYALYPTEKTTLLNVIRNSDYNWKVPF